MQCVSSTSGHSLTDFWPQGLTLIDLPGLVAAAIPGQAEDIGEQIRDLAMAYISGAHRCWHCACSRRWITEVYLTADEHTIILCVCDVNQDAARHASVKLAKMVDNDGRRTIYLLTKVDEASREITFWAHIDKAKTVLGPDICLVRAAIIATVCIRLSCDIHLPDSLAAACRLLLGICRPAKKRGKA